MCQALGQAGALGAVLFFIPHSRTQMSGTEVHTVWVAFPRVIQVAEAELEVS